MFFFLINFYFQVSNNLKVILYVTKIPQNTVAALSLWHFAAKFRFRSKFAMPGVVFFFFGAINNLSNKALFSALKDHYIEFKRTTRESTTPRKCTQPTKNNILPFRTTAGVPGGAKLSGP